jgi:hypothetical protein
MKRASTGLLAVLGLFLLAVYARAALGPLHMSTDAYFYFLRAEQLVQGKPLMDTQQPIGYPAALAALHFVGLGTIRGVIAMNFVALAIGSACSWHLLRRVLALSSLEAACVLLLTLASVTCIGFTTAAMSEVCFFATSTAALVALEKFRSNGSSWAFSAGIACVWLSIELRTAGWALAAAVLAAVWLRFHLRISKRAACAALLVAAIPLAIVVAHSRYFLDVAYGQYVGFGSAQNAMVELAEHKTKAIGEMVANYAAVNVPLIYREEFTLLGALACLVFAIGGWTLRKSLSPVTVYLAVYSALIWAFPFWDDRFWLPVMPCLIAVLFFGLREIGRRAPKAARYARPLFACYVVAFVLLGCRYSFRYASFWDGRADKAIASLQGQR